MNSEEKINKIAEELSKLNMNEVAVLIKQLEDNFGFAMPQVSGNVSGNANIEANESESVSNIVKVSITFVPSDISTKFALSKFLSAKLSIDLLSAKNLCSQVPFIVKENITRDEAKNLQDEIFSISEAIKTEIK